MLLYIVITVSFIAKFFNLMNEIKKTRAKALVFLAKRSYGTEELRRKLIKKECDEDAVNDVIIQFTKEKLLDDEDVVSQWLENVAIRRGYGYLKIKKYLLDLGFDAFLIDDCVSISYKEKEYSIGLRVAQQKKDYFSTQRSLQGDDEKIKEKVGRFLISRGFNQGIVFSIFDELF